MDPINQTNTATQGTTTPQPTSATDANVVIAGAFGGTLPTPPVISDTMPTFSFDQDDFWGTNNSTIPPTPHYENITDPFAGGITSTTSTSIPSDATIVENTVPTKDTTTTIEEKLPEGTVSLDSLEEKTPEDITTTVETNEIITPESPIIENSEEIIPTPIQEAPLPIEEVNNKTTTENIEPSTTITDNAIPTVPENQDISFDLPVAISQQTNESISFDLPTLEKPVIQDTTFDLPNQPDTTHTQGVVAEDITIKNNEIVTPESLVVQDSEESLSMSIQENPLPVKESIEEVLPIQIKETSLPTEYTIKEVKNETNKELKDENINELNEIPTLVDEDIPTIAVAEIENNKRHELQEVYDEFNQEFKNYSAFKWDLSISLVWLRTQEDEITYTFTQIQENNINIIKSNTTDILSFEQTESGLKVSLNSDSLWYYGVDQVDPDTTHFLKEKLGKFTMMLQSEYEREEKKQREWLKKIRESLRNF